MELQEMMNRFNANMNGLGWTFFAIISICGMYGIVLAYKKNREKANDMANICVALGVFGTFFGVLYGLITTNFEATEISGSISNLLRGLSVAFSTSVVGMMCSISIKFISFFKGSQVVSHEDEDVLLVREMVGNLRKIYKNVLSSSIEEKDFQKESMKKTDKIIELLTSIDKKVSVIKEFRIEYKNGNETLNNSIKSFGNNVTQNSTQAITNALNEIVENFNNKMINELGENFKHFDSAVGQMVSWQINYKSAMDNSLAQLQMSADCLNSINESVNGVADSMDAINLSSENITDLIESITQSQEYINNKFVLINGLADKFENTLISIRENASESVSSQVEAIDESFKEIKKKTFDSIRDQTNVFNNIRNNIDNISNELRDSISDVCTDIRETSTINNSQIKAQLKTMDEVYGTIANNMASEFRDMGGSLEMVIKQQINHINGVLAESYDYSIKTLGENMVTITGKVSKDYDAFISATEKLIVLCNSIEQNKSAKLINKEVAMSIDEEVNKEGNY
ncbi:MAG: hypothetical protein RR840_06740 [Clostridium sp.]